MQLDEWYLFRLVPFNVNFPNFLAIAAPHQAFLPIGSEVPLVKKSSFPPGEAKGEVAGAGTIQFTYLFREQRGAKSPYHLQIGYSCNRPDDATGDCTNTALP